MRTGQSQSRNANKKIPTHALKDAGYQALRDGMAAAYIDLGKLLERQGDAYGPGRLAKSFQSGNSPHSLGGSWSSGPAKRGTIMIAAHRFLKNVRPSAIEFTLPEPDGRLSSTSQLACCIGLLQVALLLDDRNQRRKYG
ncbi:MAG: hypothetical protein J3Q66DRAFT_397879 [Benniella sp.]|nr:MAG: hypothetical protein J3Q66DRAFT_397873 [Benniella sp.]KAK3823418.1 MAG: hypothetical protein J3Q66DRAFT_397879 [Benniella sp.]